MPAPGDQYASTTIKNPFDTERTINTFTAQEIATLQNRLNKQLGPEYVSHRTGAGGSKVAYLEGTKAIALANDVFGFNGWSSSLQQVQIDYVDEAPNNRISLGLSMVVRVTLKDGTYHEDIGYGMIENAKGKGAAFEKAKKEAATDGMKRALRSFGNVLGNCLYDKEYLKKVNSMKHKPIKFDEGNLHRHPDFAPPVKEEGNMVKREPHVTPMRHNQISRTETEQSVVSVGTEAEDEFGGDMFDGVDITEQQGEEFTFEAADEPVSKALEASRAPDSKGGLGPQRTMPAANNGPPRQPMPRVQSMPAIRQNGASVQQAPQQQQNNQGPGRPPPPQHPRGPQTPNAQQANAPPNMQNRRIPPATVDIHAPPKPPIQGQQAPQQPNQPIRQTPPQAQQLNQNPQDQAGPSRTNTPQPQPPNRPPVGFVTSRAATLLQNPESATSLTTVPAFNPHVDSPLPKEQRTPGIDHTRSMKITRDSVNAPAPPPPPPQLAPPQNQNQNPNPQHAQAQQPQPQPQAFRPVAPPAATRSNFVNPHHDANRRIGMPGGNHAMSPLANRSAYKPPGMVAGVKRPALADVSNHNSGQNGNGAGGGMGEGHEAKKQRVEGPGSGLGVENDGKGVGAVGSS